MGVPALFRWLSKKYPKIVEAVVEEEPQRIEGEDGTSVAIPLDISGPNPNGEEFDNLYLDMNGIVHPCTHPEGKPAPETEEEMMVEVFKYTERVVNMVRPRKALFMAIDGVAPRAKMNQQRSRRFRAAQEAKDKAEAHAESLLIWESMGKEVSEEERNKKSWDSNAITPGTPFMDLLANSLRYWVVKKLNTDPGWKNLQVYISDAGVPGEGEHKIMDFVRRQRVNKGHDPNTKHVIYGLDADLIMLSLATHEPNFKVLREDVFSQSDACHICGQKGHFAAQCTGPPMDRSSRAKDESPKPFIFLDVAVLREYLEVELNVPNTPFPFSFEQALDDWVLLIFFVGNDFLPHLPSLEIREGAIDTLLKIWRDELPRMGGYLTDHGQLRLPSVQIILEGLARREDDIFRRRREAEERSQQNANAKRRRTDNTVTVTTGPSAALQLTSQPTAPGLPAHPSLPAKPSVGDFAQRATAAGFSAPSNGASNPAPAAALQALSGSNSDIVANRAAIRLANMANMNAAELLKAELAGLRPVKATSTATFSAPVTSGPDLSPPDISATGPVSALDESMNEDEVPGFGAASKDTETPSKPVVLAAEEGDHPTPIAGTELVHNVEVVDAPMDDGDDEPRGQKRTFEEAEAEAAAGADADGTLIDDADAPDVVDVPSKVGKLDVQPDGSVKQEDTVKLWEPGYRERYYRQKFGVEPTDKDFKRQLVKSYVEGMAWVLHYYYQGTPSWQWYFPGHFAPFASDFEDLESLDIKFEVGQPFKPFEQLMGVFPAASKSHIPAVFHSLMTAEDSPIIDFYPETFEIDMNGKKMIWQGVALLPFIDEKRLLGAMAEPYTHLTEQEQRRNTWGNDVVYVGAENALYPSFEALYGKRKSKDPVPMDVKASRGISGTLLPSPSCIPGSTFESPLTSVGLPDIPNDRSLCACYFFPPQLTPHRSVLLPGVRRLPRVLTQDDLDGTRRRGGRGNQEERRGRGRGMLYGGSGYQGRDMSNHNQRPDQSWPSQGNNHYRDSSHGSAPGGHRGGYGQQSYQYSPGYGISRGRGDGPPRGGDPAHGAYNPPGRGGPPSYGGYGSYGNYGAPPPQPPHDYGGYGGYGGQGGGRGGGQGGYQSRGGGYGGSQYGSGAPRGRY